MMLVELTAIPVSSLPVAEFSRHLHLGTGFADDGSMDAVLESYLRAAIGAIEARIGKALITRKFSWQVTAWRNPSAQVLPVAPVTLVTALKLVDRAGTVTLAAPEMYDLLKDSQRPQVSARQGSLPQIPDGGAAEIEFDAGFGVGWSNVPIDLAQAVFLLAAHFFENRKTEGSREDLLPFGVMALIETYRPVRLFGGGV